MALFRSGKGSPEPLNMVKKPVVKRYMVNGSTCSIIIKDALFGQVDGREVLLDEIMVNNMASDIVKAVSSNSTKYNKPPAKIIINHEEGTSAGGYEKTTGNEEGSEPDGADTGCISSYKPRWSMDQVSIDKKGRKQIMAALTISKYSDKLFHEWGLDSSNKNGRAVVLNFFGPPGTGKSMMAEAIANYLGREVYSVNYSELESKYVGETPKNIKKVFEMASKKNAVLIFDEADSFLGKRLTNVSQSADYGVNITRSVMLMEIERFNGVVIFTTNLISNYDDAFKRRILASVEFKLPDEENRREIWKVHIPESIPIDKGINEAYLAKRYADTSGADIRDMLLFAAVACLQREGGSLNAEDFDEAYSFVMNRYKKEKAFSIKHEVISKEQYEKEVKNMMDGEYENEQ